MAKTELALADKELSVLDAITLKKEELTEWVKTADALIVTPETLKEADTFRKKGKNFRLEIQRIAKGNNDKLNKLKKINSDREDGFIVKTGLEAAEKKLDARIKAIEDAIEAERQAKIRADEERKRKIKQKIADIENKITESRSITDITTLNLMVASIEFFTDTFEEFNEEGNETIKRAVTAIENRVAILSDEMELKNRRDAKINSRKEMLSNYPQGYWPTDEQLGVFNQEEFEEAIVHIEAKIKADKEDVESTNGVFHDDNTIPVSKVNSTQVTFNTKMHGSTTVVMPKKTDVFIKEESVVVMPERKIEAGYEFSYQGYEFSVSANFPADVAEKIFDYIKEVVDEMPV